MMKCIRPHRVRLERRVCFQGVERPLWRAVSLRTPAIFVRPTGGEEAEPHWLEDVSVARDPESQICAHAALRCGMRLATARSKVLTTRSISLLVMRLWNGIAIER